MRTTLTTTLANAICGSVCWSLYGLCYLGWWLGTRGRTHAAHGLLLVACLTGVLLAGLSWMAGHPGQCRDGVVALCQRSTAAITVVGTVLAMVTATILAYLHHEFIG